MEWTCRATGIPVLLGLGLVSCIECGPVPWCPLIVCPWPRGCNTRIQGEYLESVALDSGHPACGDRLVPVRVAMAIA